MSSAKWTGFQRGDPGKSAKDDLFFNTLWGKYRSGPGGYL